MKYDSGIEYDAIGLGMDKEGIRYLDYNELGQNRLGIRWNKINWDGIE